MNGEEFTIGDVIYGNETTTTIRNNYQRSYIFNGLIGLAYTKSSGKLSYGVNAGIGINLQTTSKGYYYCQNEPERLEFSNFTKSNIGLSTRLGLNLGYDLTRHLTLLTQLNTGYYLTPMSKSGNAYRNVMLPGIQVGMKYKW